MTTYVRCSDADLLAIWKDGYDDGVEDGERSSYRNTNDAEVLDWIKRTVLGVAGYTGTPHA